MSAIGPGSDVGQWMPHAMTNTTSAARGERRVVVEARARVRRVVGGLRRDVDGELLADLVQPRGELGDEARVRRAVGGRAGLEVDVDAVVVVRTAGRRSSRSHAPRSAGSVRIVCSGAASWQSKRAKTSTWRSRAKLVICGTSWPWTSRGRAVALEVRGVDRPDLRGSGP